MVNTDLIEKKIEDSGKTKIHIANVLGMTRETLRSKVYGRTPWTADEMYKFCQEMGIDDPEEKVLLFLAESS